MTGLVHSRFPRLLTAFCAMATGYLMACGLPPLETGDDTLPEAFAPEPRTPCVVLRVFDGDTLACDRNGDGRYQKPDETIRLLGIDTPESRHSLKRQRQHPGQKPADEPFAREATRRLAALAGHRTVYLAWDRERTDRYGRSLAVVYADVQTLESFNETLLKEGLAKTLFFPPNLTYAARFRQAQAEARHAQRALWAESG